LKRSGARGFFLPLSGGADSSATAAIVGSMCQLVCRACRDGHEEVASSCRRVVDPDGLLGEAWLPADSCDLARRIFHTSYMGSANSSASTRRRAEALAKEIGSYHIDISIEPLVSAMLSMFALVTGLRPKYKVDGGTHPENLALQNIQARLRMVTSFLFAQLLPWVRSCRGGDDAKQFSPGGFLLVLGSANVDEGLRGYMTKYDCSSADINPIGGISKGDLQSFLLWASRSSDDGGLGYPALADIIAAPPTAELEPLRDDGHVVQLDEVDMGMSYDELGTFGRLRKLGRCGPVSMFRRLLVAWGHMSPAMVAEKVKQFFRFYSINRHKMTTLTPSYHCESYSCDDNRFDLRQFLYNTKWTWQFQAIDSYHPYTHQEETTR